MSYSRLPKEIPPPRWVVWYAVGLMLFVGVCSALVVARTLSKECSSTTAIEKQTPKQSGD